MKVQIRSRYYLRSEDLNLLPENKMRWWMKSEDIKGREAFVRIPRGAIGNNPLNLELDLVPGRYSAGCGDWNIENDEGRRVYQRVYFYITTDGEVVYVDRKADLPEINDIMDGNLPEPPEQPEFIGLDNFLAPSESADTGNYVRLENFFFCCNDSRDLEEDDDSPISIERVVLSNDSCDLYTEDTPGDEYGCGNCIFSNTLYRNSISE